MTDRLERALSRLADDVIFPATPALEVSVAVRIRRRGRAPAGWPWARSVVLAAGLMLLLVAAVAAVTWVLPGLRIVPVASVPPASVQLGDGLALGRRIDPTDATFAVEAVGAPASAYALRDGTVTSLVFAPTQDLAEIDDSGIGLLVQRIEGDLEEALVEKLVEEVGARVTPVTVGDADGFWIEGPPHLVRYLTPAGAVRAEMTRLVGDTLVWQRAGILYRMESSLGLEASRRLAASVVER